jgi:hypothetical protein
VTAASVETWRKQARKALGKGGNLNLQPGF